MNRKGFRQGAVEIRARSQLFSTFTTEVKKISATTDALALTAMATARSIWRPSRLRLRETQDMLSYFRVGNVYVPTGESTSKKSRSHEVSFGVGLQRIELKIVCGGTRFDFTDFKGKKRRLSEFREIPSDHFCGMW